MEQSKECGGQHWPWNVRSENKTHSKCECYSVSGSGGLAPGKISHVGSSESVFLDTYYVTEIATNRLSRNSKLTVLLELLTALLEYLDLFLQVFSKSGGGMASPIFTTYATNRCCHIKIQNVNNG